MQRWIMAFFFPSSSGRTFILSPTPNSGTVRELLGLEAPAGLGHGRQIEELTPCEQPGQGSEWIRGSGESGNRQTKAAKGPTSGGALIEKPRRMRTRAETVSVSALS